MLNGSSWQTLMSTVPGHQPVSMKRVVYCGLRNQSDEEEHDIQASGATVVEASSEGDLSEKLQQALASQRRGTSNGTIVHLDLDVLDPDDVGWANEFPSQGGLGAEELSQCMETVAAHRPLALTVCSYMPGLAGGQDVCDAAVDGIVRFCDRALSATTS